MNSHSEFQTRIPDFGISVPLGYRWLLEKKLVGFEPFSQMEPWYYIDASEHFEIESTWPAGKQSAYLVAFARRQDTDEIACFNKALREEGEVVVIQGWTDNGYDITCTYASFWDWVKSVVDDIAVWVASGGVEA